MAETAYLDYDGVKYLTDKLIEKLSIPIGSIIMWSGTAFSVPRDWALCDGQNGTPDLRGRFIIGSGDAYITGDTGGEVKHTLTVSEMPAHRHSASGISLNEDGMGGSLFSGGEDSFTPTAAAVTGSSGQGQPFSLLPPYYALAYIMKIS